MSENINWSYFNDHCLEYRQFGKIVFKNSVEGDDAGLWDIEVVFTDDPRGSATLKAEFFRCFGIHTVDLFSAVAIELKVIDVSSHQIEGARYKIVDNESGAIDFYCHSLRFTNIRDK